MRYCVWFILPHWLFFSLFTLPHTFLSARTHTHTYTHIQYVLMLLVKTAIKCLNHETMKNMLLRRSQLFTWNCYGIIVFYSFIFILSFIDNLCNKNRTHKVELNAAFIVWHALYWGLNIAVLDARKINLQHRLFFHSDRELKQSNLIVCQMLYWHAHSVQHVL